MNKKYSVLVAVILFFSTSLSFAGDKIQRYYSGIRKAFAKNPNTGEFLKEFLTNTTVMYPDRAKEIVEKHKEESELLKERYLPMIFKVLSPVFGILASLGLGTSIYGAVRTSQLLNGPGNGKMATGGLSYPGFLNYFYTNSVKPKDYFANQITQKFMQGLSEDKGATVLLGIAAPVMAVGSIVLAALAAFLWKKAAHYKAEIEELDKDIALDGKILNKIAELFPQNSK